MSDLIVTEIDIAASSYSFPSSFSLVKGFQLDRRSVEQSIDTAVSQHISLDDLIVLLTITFFETPARSCRFSWGVTEKKSYTLKGLLVGGV